MRTFLLLAASALLAPAPLQAQYPPTERKAVRSIDDLPRFSYPYRGRVADLIERPELLAPLVAKAEADVRATLAGYAIEDRATLRGLHKALLATAMFRRDYLAVRREIARVRELADKPLGKVTAGDVELAYAEAAGTAPPGSPDFAVAFRRVYAAGLTPLPWLLYGDAAREKMGQNALLSRVALVGGFAPLYQPQVDRGGALDEAALRTLVSVAVLVRDVTPLKAELLAADRAYLQANVAAVADIWPARDASFPKGVALSPVVVAIWDSGTDASVFPGRLWTNGRERANGLDDDGNGYVDDLHGVAVDRDGARSVEQLEPVPAGLRPRLSDAAELAIGFRDQVGGEETSAARRFTAFIDGADMSQMARFWDDHDFYGSYSHGTHVAGIVERGNAAVRLLLVRRSFDWRTPPRRPTEAIARAYAQAYADQVAYMKAAGVRVVNMSWTVDIKTEYENQLAANGVPEAERAAEARRLFAIEADGLRRAIASAPDTLFICAAGNSNNSAAFQGSVPAAFDLPNVVTVAAVGADGGPTSFTTTGPTVDIAANGYRVDSFVPGGRRARFSGTSMASPNVANAAAKLLALRPALTTAELRALLLDTATPGEGGLKLLNGRAAVERLGVSRR